MASKEGIEFGEKVRLGLDLYWKRLVEKYAREDGELVLSVNKKIVHVKARDLLDTI